MNRIAISPLMAALLSAATLLSGPCLAPAGPAKQLAEEKASVELTRVPNIIGGPSETAEIAGKVTGLATTKSFHIVIYSKSSGIYYVQPTVASPYTDIESDGAFSTDIHGGEAFVALLVREGYKPEAQTEQLPKVGGQVLAISPQKRRGSK